MINPVTGLTDHEQAVHDALVESTNAFFALPEQHPDERAEFAAAIHRAQDLLAVRIARRHFPEGWPTKTAP